MRIAAAILCLGLASSVQAGEYSAWYDRCVASAPPRLTNTPVEDWPGASACASMALMYCRFVSEQNKCLTEVDENLSARIEALRAPLPMTADDQPPRSTDDAEMDRYLFHRSLNYYLELERTGSFKDAAHPDVWGQLVWINDPQQEHFYSQIMRIGILTSLHARFDELERQ